MKFNRIMLSLFVFLAGSCFGMNVLLLGVPATRDKPFHIASATTALLAAVLAHAVWKDRRTPPAARRCQPPHTTLNPMIDSLPWSTEPNVSGRYLCLRDGVFTLYDIDYYSDPQTGISQWDATEICSGTRAGWSPQPAHWLLVSALPLPLPQGGGAAVTNTSFTYSATVEVELTMEQLANIIVHLGSDQQARLISLMAEVDFSIPTQLQYVTDDEALTDGGRRLMELIGAYAKPLPAGEVE